MRYNNLSLTFDKMYANMCVQSEKSRKKEKGVDYMKMIDCIRMLMDVNRVTQARIARWRGVSTNTISILLNGKDIKCGAAADVLEYMGYEIIVREKTMRRRNDEILIDTGENAMTPERMKLLLEESEAKRLEKEALEKHYAPIAADLRKKYPRGMGVNQLIVYFKKQNSLIHKYFDGYFFHKRVPIEEVIRIMKENKL